MQRALELAARVPPASVSPNPRVGCVLVKAGRIVGEGQHEWCGGPHAEVVALNQAGAAAAGSTAYVTQEPCCHQGRTGPCTTALIDAGVSRVVAAMGDPNPLVAGQGFSLLEQAGIDVEVGSCAEQAAGLNPGYLSRMTLGRPRVRVKIAMSLDGKTALASGESRWITSEASRLEVHQLRAESDLVITGVETVLADDPALTVRHVETAANPARLVVDSRLRTPVTARLLTEPGATTIVCIEGQQFAAGDLEQAGARVLALPEARGRVSLPALMARLGADEINEVLVEAGATLTGALLEQGLVDELILYVGPCLLGAAGRGMAELPGVTEMSQRLALDILAVQPVGRDWRITARPDRTAETGAH